MLFYFLKLKSFKIFLSKRFKKFQTYSYKSELSIKVIVYLGIEKDSTLYQFYKMTEKNR